MPDLPRNPPPRRRIAVIGGGVSGLTAAWVLQRTADVTLYEADDRLDGHAHTHDVVRPAGGTVAVDTGFIVHNERTYPTLLRLFAALGVATQPSDMSMSVRCEGCGLEYAGARGLAGLFPARSNLRPAYLRMLHEVPRFHRAARALLLVAPEAAGPRAAARRSPSGAWPAGRDSTTTWRAPPASSPCPRGAADPRLVSCRRCGVTPD